MSESVRSVPPPIGVPRRRPLSILLLPSLATVIGFAAWALTDKTLLNAAWVVLVAGCVFGIAVELHQFRQRLGVGALVMWGGILIWFCQDYFSRHAYGFTPPIWGGWTSSGPGPATLARVSLLHFVFITLATVALRSRAEWLARLFARIPTASNPKVLLRLILMLFVVGILPYFLLTRHTWYVALWRAFTGLRSGNVQWVVRRTGNMNYSWAGYYQQWLGLGVFASLLAGFYALFLARTRTQRYLCWAMWTFSAATAWGSGSRGRFVAMVAPILGLAFVRYGLRLRARVGSTLRAYALLGLVIVAAFAAIQIQGRFRESGFRRATLDESLVDPVGNDMFSASMLVLQLIPERAPPFYADSFLEGALRAVPQTIGEFLIGPIPRALWRDKPIDESWEYVNLMIAGTGTAGTTISKGLIGHWYAKFGLGGVLTGAVFWGLLFAWLDRSLWANRREHIRLLFVLAALAFMFRTFRDIFWHDLYPLLIGVAAYSIVLKSAELFARGKK